MADLIIKIGASAKEFRDEMSAVEKKTEDLSETLKEVGKVAAIAFAATAAAIGLAVNEYAEAEKVANRTNNILKATGGIAGVTAKEVNELAAALQKETTFSDEAVQSAENVLLTFTHIGKDVFPTATEATLDLATRMGTDAASAAETLGKALESPEQGVTRLARAGIIFTESQKAQVKAFQDNNDIASAQKIILDQLASTIGGLAKGEVVTLSGSMLQAKNAISDVAEEIGSEFAPYVTSAAKIVRDLSIALKENEGLATAVAVGLAAIAAVSGAAAVLVGISQAVLALNAALIGVGLSLGALVAPLAILAGVVAMAGTAWWAYKSAQSEAAKEVELHAEAVRALKETTFEEFQAERDLERRTREAKNAHQNAIDAENAAANNARRDARNAEFALTMAELQGFDTEYINQRRALNQLELQMQLEKDKTKLAQMQAQHALMSENFTVYANQALEAQVAADVVMAEQFSLKEQEYLANNQRLLTTIQNQNRQSQLTEKTAYDKYLTEKAKTEIDSQNTRLLETHKFNKAYAEINYALRSTELGQSATYFATMQNMTQSHNSILKGIGKAAALTQIGIDTARGATQALTAFPIPFVGPALGMAAAAAIIAFGVERSAQVMGAADGGLLTGGRAGTDSIPMLGMPGELVVPTRNFDEVINAMVAQRTGQSPQATPTSDGSGGGTVRVIIEMNDQASQIITAKQIEDISLGLSRSA